MYLKQFVSDILNIDFEQIQELQDICQSDETIVIKIKLKDKRPLCSYCQSRPKIKGYYPRTLTHSTFANRPCTLIYQQRRYKCDVCDLTFHEINPFTNSSDNSTHETKINILTDLKNPGVTYTLIAERYNVSKSTVLRIFDKHINIERKTLPRVLSMDEHYFPNSDYDSLYCVLLMNFETGEIVDVIRDRKKAVVTKYFSDIYAETLDYETHTSELNNVKYLSIDLYDNYRDIARNMLPNAVICADSFHVTKHLTEDFHDIRMRCYKSTDNASLKYLLQKFKYIFYHNTKLDGPGKYNRSLKRYANYRDIMEVLFDNFPELKIAYDLKEEYLLFNETANTDNAAEKLDRQIKLFADCGIPEYDEFYRLLRNWRQEIINSFSYADSKRINNSYIESKNRILERLISNANGFNNFERTRKRIMYCLNKNDTFMF